MEVPQLGFGLVVCSLDVGAVFIVACFSLLLLAAVKSSGQCQRYDELPRLRPIRACLSHAALIAENAPTANTRRTRQGCFGDLSSHRLVLCSTRFTTPTRFKSSSVRTNQATAQHLHRALSGGGNPLAARRNPGHA